MFMNGIDISSHQTGIDLNTVPCDFVIVKITGGTGYQNPDAQRALKQALAAGKKTGIYHYAREKGYQGSAAAEAEFFLKNAEPYIGTAVLVLDWEEELNLGVGWAKEWLDYVQNKTGVKPLIYMSKSVCRAYDWSAVVGADYGLWAAQYADMNQTGYQSEPWTDGNGYGAWAAPAVFQYSSCGRLNGWNGNLDLDLAYMDASGWDKYARGNRQSGGQNSNTEKRCAVIQNQNEGSGQKLYLETQPDGSVRLKDQASGLYLTVPSENAENGTILEFAPLKEQNAASQEWKLVEQSQRYAQYILLETKMVQKRYVSVENNGLDGKNKLKLWDELNHAKQRFWIRQEEDGAYVIIHTDSLMAVAAAGNHT